MGNKFEKLAMNVIQRIQSKLLAVNVECISIIEFIFTEDLILQ